MGIFPPFGNDHDRNISFCLDTDIRYVALSAGQVAGQSPKGIHRVLSEVDSPYNGVTFCFGKSYMAGDDIASNIQSYKEKIIMVHLRDVRTRLPEGASPEVEKRLAEIGYLEVQPGRGEIDLLVAVRALKEMGYTGQVYPEHYPSIAGDHGAGLAWVIGYFRAMDSLISP